MYKIAKQSGSLLHVCDDEEAIVDPNGSILDDLEAEEHAKLLWDDGLIAEAFEYSRSQRNSISPDRSLFDFLAEKAENIFADEPAAVAHRKRQTLLLIARMWGSYIGGPVEKQSLRYLLARRVHRRSESVCRRYIP